MTEPKKYIFVFDINDEVDIVELSWISCSGFHPDGNATVYEFMSQERFNQVIKFHQDTNNHCPFLNQSWMSRPIDLWESYSNFVIYDTFEQATEASKKYQENL